MLKEEVCQSLTYYLSNTNTRAQITVSIEAVYLSMVLNAVLNMTTHCPEGSYSSGDGSSVQCLSKSDVTFTFLYDQSCFLLIISYVILT